MKGDFELALAGSSNSQMNYELLRYLYSPTITRALAAKLLAAGAGKEENHPQLGGSYR